MSKYIIVEQAMPDLGGALEYVVQEVPSEMQTYGNRAFETREQAEADLRRRHGV